MRITVLILLCTFILLIKLKAQDKGFRPTYNYDGYLELSAEKKLPIKLNFLVLLDSSIVGSYYYEPQNGSLKLSGVFNKDYTVTFFEWDNKKHATGRFDGKVSKDRRSITGIWTSVNQKHKYPFSLNLVVAMKSYWDYIRRDRALKEYHNIDSALSEPDKVLSVDLGDQHHNKLPNKIITLKKMLSINLLGNDFKTFPIALTKLPQLEEASFASTGMTHVIPEIGRLKNLRILILDFNEFSTVPVEIGELTNLLYLDVSMNKNLKSLPSTIANLKQLQELRIENTGISSQEVQRIKNWLPQCVIVSK